MESFTQYLTRELDERDMTQADVARLSGLSTGLVAQVFSGRTRNPRFSTVLAICNAMGLSIDDAARHFKVE